MKSRQRGATFGSMWSHRRRRYLERVVLQEVTRHPDTVWVRAWEGNLSVSYVG